MAFNFSDFDQQAKKALDHIRQELASLRTGRANTQLLDPVMVEAYGTRMRLHEVANVSAPDPNMLLVSPWDKGLLAAVEKAIASSGLNMNPVVDGSAIRIVIPQLTAERRQEMVKLLHQRVEAGRVMLRNVRTAVKKDIDDQKGAANISEDDIANDLKNLELKLQEAMKTLDQLAADKEKELLTI